MLSAFLLRRNFISLVDELSRRFGHREPDVPNHDDVALAMEMEHRGASVALVHEAAEPCNHFVIECRIGAAPAPDQRDTPCRMLALNRDYIRAGLGSFSICTRREELLLSTHLPLDGVTADDVVNTLDALVDTSASWSEVVAPGEVVEPMSLAAFAGRTPPGSPAHVLDRREAFIDLVLALVESNDDMELLEVRDDESLCVDLMLHGRHFELSHALPRHPYLSVTCSLQASGTDCDDATLRRLLQWNETLGGPCDAGFALDEGSDRIAFIQAFDLEAEGCGAAVLDLMRSICERPELPARAPGDIDNNSEGSDMKPAGGGLWPPFFGLGLRA